MNTEKKVATFENSVAVLVRAYMNDTLEHINCYACAVGNLVAAANNYHYCKVKGPVPYNQTIALKENDGIYNFGKFGAGWFHSIRASRVDINTVCDELDSIGYTPKQAQDIETAFEGANCRDDAMFNGLLAVVDVLAEIHGIDLSTKEQAIGQFAEVSCLKSLKMESRDTTAAP